MFAVNGRDDQSSKQIEIAVRASLEQRAGRTLTDPEWAAARARLIEFAGILRGWDRKDDSVAAR